MRDLEELVRKSKQVKEALDWAREVASSCLLQAKQGLKEEARGFVKFAEACWKLRYKTLQSTSKGEKNQFAIFL